MNHDDRFGLWVDVCIDALTRSRSWQLSVTLRAERFARIMLQLDDAPLQVEFVNMGLSLTAAITNAQSKAAGIFPPDLARVLLSASEEDWHLILWHQGPSAERFVADLHQLGEELLLYP